VSLSFTFIAVQPQYIEASTKGVDGDSGIEVDSAGKWGGKT